MDIRKNPYLQAGHLSKSEKKINAFFLYNNWFFLQVFFKFIYGLMIR